MLNKDREVWKTHPDYPFLQANQFGEVRTKDRIVIGKGGRKYHIKGRVLSQYLQKNGYLFVHFKMNGKTVNLMVHRIVAACFLSNPNNLPEVNHIDNNRANNCVSNLEWCTKKYNEDYKKNFGTTQAEIQGRPVFAVDLNTGKVLRFETRREAARQLGVSQGNIYSVVKGKLYQIGGYWFTEDESEITEEKIREIKVKMKFYGGVLAINLEAKKVLYFESQRDAARQLRTSLRTN